MRAATRHCASSARSAAGLSGLLQHLDALRARASSRTAGERSAVIRIAGSRRRSARAAPRSPRCRCRGRGDSRPAGRSAAPSRSSIAASAAVEVGRLEHAQPQPPSSVSMPSRIVGSLSMHSTVMPASWPGSTRGVARAPAASTGSARRRAAPSTEKCEPSPDARAHLDVVAEHARDALDDRQAEARGRARPRAPWSSRWNSTEDLALLRLRNADAGVVDVDAQIGRRRAGSRPARGPAACI